jgi:GAF domain-containing protein
MMRTRTQPGSGSTATIAGDHLAVLSQALLAARSTGDLGTGCSILGSCAVHGLEAADYRVLKIDPRTGSIRSIEASGTETPYLAEPQGSVERAIQGELSIFDPGEDPDASREEALWTESPAALATVTLESGGALRGLLLVAFSGPRLFEATERLFLQTVGDTLAIVLERDALRSDLDSERARLEQLDRERVQDEESSSNLMSVVAHEIRTPLTASKA